MCLSKQVLFAWVCLIACGSVFRSMSTCTDSGATPELSLLAVWRTAHPTPGLKTSKGKYTDMLQGSQVLELKLKVFSDRKQSNFLPCIIHVNLTTGSVVQSLLVCPEQAMYQLYTLSQLETEALTECMGVCMCICLCEKQNSPTSVLSVISLQSLFFIF